MINNFQIFKDDSCVLTDVYISGVLTISASVINVSGLVNKVTKNISQVFNALNIIVLRSPDYTSMIAITTETSVILDRITMSGIIKDELWSSSSDPQGGVFASVGGGLTITLTSFRLMGFTYSVYSRTFMGLLVGIVLDSTINIEDLVISGSTDQDMTGIGFDVSEIDYADVSFIGKADDASDTLKNNLKLKNLF